MACTCFLPKTYIFFKFKRMSSVFSKFIYLVMHGKELSQELVKLYAFLSFFSYFSKKRDTMICISLSYHGATWETTTLRSYARV